ncbi:MAG: archease [Thermoprotei archaeon]|nr:MAG: archease [Thermoprotei archaeon]
MSSKEFEYLEHTADVYIVAYGKDLNEAFENAAKAMFNVMTDIDKVVPSVKREINAEGVDLEQLLYNWLENLLILFDTDGLVFSRFKVSIQKKDNHYVLKGEAWGEPFNPSKHPSKTEVKAVTYSLMEIHDEKGNSYVKFVLDI